MPRATRFPAKPSLGYAALAFVFLISSVYRLRDTSDRIAEMRHGTTLAELPFNLDFPQFSISEVRPEAEEAGLQPGDAVVELHGRPIHSGRDVFVPLRHARAGERLSVGVASAADGSRRTASIRLQPVRHAPPTALEWGAFALVNVAMPFLCMGLGFWVVAVRVRDRLAWLLLVLLLALAEFAGGHWRTLLGRDDAFQPIALLYQPVLASLWPATMMLFGIYFPERLELDRRFPWAKWIVMAPILFRIFVTTVTLQLMFFGSLPAAVQIDRRFGAMTGIVSLLHLAAMLVFFLALRYKTRKESNPDARRRLRLLHWGAVVAITPIFVVIVITVAGLIEFPRWLMMPLLIALFIFPLTMAYVIVVQRAMDVRVVVRQGLQYLLARGSLRAVQFALSVAIVAAAATFSVAANPFKRLLMISAALGAVLLIRAYADRLRRWVDRRFFREAYDAEQILGDLARRVRTMVETGPLLETVARRISETLHVPRIAILLNGAGALHPAYALGYPQLPAIAMTEDRLTEHTERILQETLGSELLLPLSSNQKLLGVMGLGPKQSEEPFSGSDIRLLDAVAMQTGLALENSRLTAEIAAEVATREKAKRELEIAREVQQRLFPQDCPPIAGIDYAGACRAALGVGGDYYDFIRISATELGIAIGDVSGKGVPAALLMATLRAYLRGQTIRRESDLAGLMTTLNALVYESSASNRYATFFYGQYETATRQLHYVNAGHNPPMVFRQGSAGIIRLDTGGPVIGLFEGSTYTEGRITLERGDLLVAFTDGVSEAIDAADVEWGETGLIEAVRSSGASDVRELIARIMTAADAFVAGAAQYDDMTLVVVRVT